MSFAFNKMAYSPPQRTVTYLIGEPGAGKSALAAHLTRGLAHADRDKPFAHRLYTCGVYELGKRRPDYPGTDALSMSVQPVVLEWLEQNKPFHVFGEGDRLGNGSFMEAVEGLGYAVNLWVIQGPEQADLHRRIRGSNQDPEWLAGRQSKVRNLAESRKHRVLIAGSALGMMEEAMLSSGDAVVRALRGIR